MGPSPKIYKMAAAKTSRSHPIPSIQVEDQAQILQFRIVRCSIDVWIDFEHEYRKVRKPNNEQMEVEVRCVFTNMSPSMITPRRLLAFENRTADSRLDDLSSPTSASARTLGLGFALLSLPHRDAKKAGSERKCKVTSKDRRVKEGGGEEQL